MEEGRTNRRNDEDLGRDELNLAEFPVALIGKRAPGHVKTLRFTDSVYDRGKGQYVTRTLTVTGSDLWGLPSQFDDEVLLGCIQLTKDQGFKTNKVQFTRYELLKILDRPPDGRNYQRVSQSLDRWAGTLFISDKAWWDKDAQCWVKDTFNLIDRVNLVEKESLERKRAAGDSASQRSWFIWGDFMWRSFQAGNLKEIDFEFWKTLRLATSKRLYRILDKRFFFGPVAKFDLHTLAYEKIGLSRNMHTGQIKEKLRPANEELKKRGVCSGEFVKKERGKWQVVYKQHGIKSKTGRETADLQLVSELVKRGVSRKKASRLALRFSNARISEKLRLFDWHARHGKKKQPGFLVAAIEQNYALTEPTFHEDSRKPEVSKTEPKRNNPTRGHVEAQPDLSDELKCLSEKESAVLEAKAISRRGQLFLRKYERYQTEDPAKFQELRQFLIESELRRAL